MLFEESKEFPFAGKSIFISSSPDYNRHGHEIPTSSIEQKPHTATRGRRSMENPVISGSQDSVSHLYNRPRVQVHGTVRNNRLSAFRRRETTEENPSSINSNQQLPKLDVSPSVNSSPSPSKHVAGRIRRQYQYNTTSPNHNGSHTTSPVATLSPMTALSTLVTSSHLSCPSDALSLLQSQTSNSSQEVYGTSAACTLKGLKPGKPDWINQDSYFMAPLPEGDVYCVLDGHGEHGHLVSASCRAILPQLLAATQIDLTRAFCLMQQNLVTSHEFDVSCSGATCVVVSVTEKEIKIAHCGDSRAVLGRRCTMGGYTAVQLTEDHKPNRPDEHRRIVSNGGQVGSRQMMLSGQMGGVTLGPCRVWYRNGTEILGLAMSRSLGDAVVHGFGVSAEPEVTRVFLNSCAQNRDEFLILATDGLWDVIDSTQAVRVVGSLIDRAQQEQKDWNPIVVSNYLCQLARRRWEGVSAMVDDITCLVVKLNRKLGNDE